MNLLNEACDEFGTDAETVGKWFLSEDWEKMDVAIRCYLLSQAIGEALDDMADELDEAFDEEWNNQAGADGAVPGFDSPACFYPGSGKNFKKEV